MDETRDQNLKIVPGTWLLKILARAQTKPREGKIEGDGLMVG